MENFRFRTSSAYIFPSFRLNSIGDDLYYVINPRSNVVTRPGWFPCKTMTLKSSHEERLSIWINESVLIGKQFSLLVWMTFLCSRKLNLYPQTSNIVKVIEARGRGIPEYTDRETERLTHDERRLAEEKAKHEEGKPLIMRQKWAQQNTPEYKLPICRSLDFPPWPKRWGSKVCLLEKAAAIFARLFGILIENEDMCTFEENLSTFKGVVLKILKRSIARATRKGRWVMPLIQTPGHLESALKHERYAKLREIEGVTKTIIKTDPEFW